MKNQAIRRVLGIILLLIGCGLCLTSAPPEQEWRGWKKGEPWLPAYVDQAMPWLVGSLIALSGVIVLAWQPRPRYNRWGNGFARERCQRCAYDLSGLPPGTACPECGLGRPQR